MRTRLGRRDTGERLGLQCRNGPPEAVSSSRRTPGGRVPICAPAGRHWKMALCSLSIGTICAPERRTV